MKPARELLSAPIRFYRRRISPFTQPSCRFRPSCSGYALTALKRHGALKGLLLSIWRVLRCNPFFRGGYDPVPPVGKWTPEIRFLMFSPVGVKGKRKNPPKKDPGVAGLTAPQPKSQFGAREG